MVVFYIGKVDKTKLFKIKTSTTRLHWTWLRYLIYIYLSRFIITHHPITLGAAQPLSSQKNRHVKTVPPPPRCARRCNRSLWRNSSWRRTDERRRRTAETPSRLGAAGDGRLRLFQNMQSCVFCNCLAATPILESETMGSHWTWLKCLKFSFIKKQAFPKLMSEKKKKFKKFNWKIKKRMESYTEKNEKNNGSFWWYPSSWLNNGLFNKSLLLPLSDSEDSWKVKTDVWKSAFITFRKNCCPSPGNENLASPGHSKHGKILEKKGSFRWCFPLKNDDFSILALVATLDSQIVKKKMVDPI